MEKEKLTQIINDAIQSGTWLSNRNAAREIARYLKVDDKAFERNLKVAFVSSFTIDPLVDYTLVSAAQSSIGLTTYIAPYGQTSQEILDPQSALYAFSPDVTVLVDEPHTLAGNPQEAAQQILTLSDAFKQNGSGLLIVADFIAPSDWPLHVLPSEKKTQIRKANQFLAEHLVGADIQIFGLDSVAAYHGYTNTFSPEMLSMARIPFSEGFLCLMAQKLLSHLKIPAGLIRKCLVLDCDNTLWGGIIGEDGMDGIILGPDWPGREFLDFQKTILELYQQGVILAINSKNNEADVMTVLREHPHMLLREKHFAAIVANWQPKPENMRQIAAEINIGIETLVFVDDNPAEQSMMTQMLPEVAVLELPANPALYAKTLRQTNYFAKASLTEEDKKRGQIYAAQRQRQVLQKQATSLADYLKSLEMVCSIHHAEQKDVKRAAQLTQRTNQFNLTTRRYSEADIQQLLVDPNWNIYVLGLKDKFGDNGTVGLALVEKQDTTWRIDTFLMSCRVIGRQAEEALVDRICADAVSEEIDKLTAEYIKTAKNGLVDDFWEKMNFTHKASSETTTRYQYNLSQYQPKTFEYLTFEE